MERYYFDFKKLLNDGIIYITQCMDLSTGKMCEPEIDPMTGEYSDPRDFSNLITLYNLRNPEAGTQDHIFKAMRNLRPDLVDQWQRDQKTLVDAKYNQILWGINQKNKRPEDYLADKPQKEMMRISDIISGQDASKQYPTNDVSFFDINEQIRDLLKSLTKVSKPLASNLDDILKKFSYFETAQGSKYIRNDKGQLRRWKSAHANTGGEDMGLHGWSSQSIFVPKNYENEANSLQHLIGKGFKTAMSKNKDGKLVIMVADKGKWRPATWSDAYPNYVKSNPSFKDKVIGFEYSKEPKMGYNVVDFDLKPSSTEIKSYHFGSPVSKIETQIPKEEIKRFFPTQN